MIIRWVHSQHFALPKRHFIHRTKQGLLSYQINTVFRFLNTNRCILNSLWTWLQYSSIPQHYSPSFYFITASMQKVQCLWNKIWPNALSVTNGAKLLKFGVFTKSHSSEHILWSKGDSMMWCWYWSLCSLSLASTASERNPQHSAPHIKNTSRRRRDAPLSVWVLPCVPQIVMLHSLKRLTGRPQQRISIVL